MKERDDLLIEILTEELPPKSLLKLATVFSDVMQTALHKANFTFESCKIFATPRRLALLIKQINFKQDDHEVERKGPTLKAAFDAEGKPTQACLGFARACGVTIEELQIVKNAQGEWVYCKQKIQGQTLEALLPNFVAEAATALPIPKRMRWGEGETQFVRPVHAVILLFGDWVIAAPLLGVMSGQVTQGHRFMTKGAIKISHAEKYEAILETKGFVIADFAKRREIIKEKTMARARQLLKQADAYLEDDLLDEVTGLVEWPVILSGVFDKTFLTLPKEVLTSAMQDHQRYFPVKESTDELLPYFIFVSNIESDDPALVIHGNERVLRARLEDAQFFYTTDQKESLQARLPRLKGITFHAKLGSLHDKAERLAALSVLIAEKLSANIADAKRAGMLAKTDLTTDMVNEFPELQGVMGNYYAQHDKESAEICYAMREQYLPRFAGDTLPEHAIAQALAIADRMDLLVGVFGINQIPTGDKDPFGLRRAALGVLRILIEKQLPLDIKTILEAAVKNYQVPLENKNIIDDVLNFMQDRLRAWYVEQGISTDIFAAVSALHITIPLDIHARIKAVQAFKKLKEAETLSIANKRVSNILSKYDENITAKKINPEFFENKSEKELAHQLEVKSQALQQLYQLKKYEEALVTLAELREPIDDFFDHVMVMTEDKTRRENRILLLSKLRALFLQVADIALLQ